MIMRSKFAHQYLQQEEELDEEQYPHRYRRSQFLPMLCSFSSSSTPKQVAIKLTHQGQRHRRCSSTSSTASSTVSEEPLSPRVGCMGQVKRNNKVVVFPASGNTAIKNDQIFSNYTSKGIFKYKRFFSSKSLTGTGSLTATIAAPNAVTRNGTNKGKVKSVVPNKEARPNTVRHDHHYSIKSRSKTDKNHAGNVTGSSNKNNENEAEGCLVNLVELDPPLPVVKLKVNNNEESVSLWKRRSGGTPLKSLHVQAIPESCNLLVQANTV